MALYAFSLALSLSFRLLPVRTLATTRGVTYPTAQTVPGLTTILITSWFGLVELIQIKTPS